MVAELVKYLQLDMDARQWFYILAAFLSLSDNVSIDMISDVSGLARIVAMNGIRRSENIPEVKAEFAEKLWNIEKERFVNSIVDRTVDDLTQKMYYSYAVLLHAKSWILDLPEWDVYDPSANSRWLAHCHPLELDRLNQVLKVNELFLQEGKTSRLRDVEVQVAGVCPGVLMRTP